MKYFGEPGAYVVDYDNLRHVFRFDENGEFETEDRTLIEWMRKNKGFIRCQESAVFEAAAGAEPEPADELRARDEPENYSDPIEPDGGLSGPVEPENADCENEAAETLEDTEISQPAAEAEAPAVSGEVRVPEFKCRKCGFAAESKGQLLSHYKKEHSANQKE